MIREDSLKVTAALSLALLAQCSVLYRTMRNSIKKVVCLWIILLVISGLTACDDKKQQVAAAGDHAVLEQLAEAYRKVSEKYPVQPQAMPPGGRKKFLDTVFKQAGYSYSATLIAMGQSVADSSNQEKRDLVELLLLPVKGVSNEVRADLYTDDELVAMQRLQTGFR